jgi:hypothetical protein
MALKASISGATRLQSRQTSEVAPNPVEEAPESKPKGEQARAGMKSIGFWTTDEARRQLHRIAIDEDTTAGDLLNEALNLLFRDRDKPTIAATKIGN